MKTTLKDIKNTIAIDITKLSTKEVYEIYHNEHGFKSVAYSTDVYGVTGAVIQPIPYIKLHQEIAIYLSFFMAIFNYSIVKNTLNYFNYTVRVLLDNDSCIAVHGCNSINEALSFINSDNSKIRGVINTLV